MTTLFGEAVTTSFDEAVATSVGEAVITSSGEALTTSSGEAWTITFKAWVSRKIPFDEAGTTPHMAFTISFVEGRTPFFYETGAASFGEAGAASFDEADPSFLMRLGRRLNHTSGGKHMES